MFVQNDQPVNWEWKDNIGFGRKCPETSGFMIKNPEIKRNELNLMIPTLNTISSEVSDEFNEILESDLFGNKRKNTRTVGAIQFPASGIKNKPLTEEKVGAIRSN